MTHRCIIRGSYGDLTVDTRTGAVLSYDDGETTAGPEVGVYFDIALFRPTHLPRNPWGTPAAADLPEEDILGVGFWTVDGVYVERLYWDADKEAWLNFAGALPAPKKET